ncbi:hypothetical protein MRX96_028847 [Rhipicephalus microplus]
MGSSSPSTVMKETPLPRIGDCFLTAEKEGYVTYWTHPQQELELGVGAFCVQPSFAPAQNVLERTADRRSIAPALGYVAFIGVTRRLNDANCQLQHCIKDNVAHSGTGREVLLMGDFNGNRSRSTDAEDNWPKIYPSRWPTCAVSVMVFFLRVREEQQVYHGLRLDVTQTICAYVSGTLRRIYLGPSSDHAKA